MGDSFRVECIMKRLPQIAQWFEVFDDYSKYKGEKLCDISIERINDDNYAEEAVCLEQHLLERIDEVRRINQMIHSSLAISCILNYLYFLARLMSENKIDDVAINFCKFFSRYVRRISCRSVEGECQQNQKIDREKTERGQMNTFGSALLKMGLGSVIPLEVAVAKDGKMRCSDENCPQMMLFYGKLDGGILMDLMEDKGDGVHSVDLSGAKLEVNIDDLCVSIKRGIRTMFCDRSMVKKLLMGMKDYSVLKRMED